jgi:hypothetical protein
MKRTKKVKKLDFVKNSVLEFKSLINIRGGRRETNTNGGNQLSTDICQDQEGEN